MYYKCTKCNGALRTPQSQGRDFLGICNCSEETTFHRMERIRSGHDYGKDEVFRCMMDGSKLWILSMNERMFLPYTKNKPARKG